VIKGQCKINNDYKSLAAVARIQRKAAFDGEAIMNNYKSQGDVRYVDPRKNRLVDAFSYETLAPMDKEQSQGSLRSESQLEKARSRLEMIL